MTPFSIVIICKNEAAVLGQSLEKLSGVTDDIIVYDNGSTDGTQQVVKKFPVRLIEGPWEGFGPTKNKANRLAKNDWILSLDADETLDDVLITNLQNWQPENENEVVEFSFRNFLGNTPIRYGDWGHDYHIRLFNRHTTKWDEAAVHEKLLLPAEVMVKKIKGLILHRTWRNETDYKSKMDRYAALGAEKYFAQGRKANWFRLHFSPAFAFISSYIFKLGFLDGNAGYTCARMMCYYTKKKYEQLKALQKNSANRK